MEKLRNAQQRDLTLSKLDRARHSLILQTFKELNTQYNNNNRRIQPPLAFNRVKVTFKDEPGEGSGVARSFYTLIAESLLSNENLPNLESAQVGSNKYSVPFSTMIRQRGGVASGTGAGSSLSNIASNASNRGSDFNRRMSQKQSLWKPTKDNNKKMLLNYDSRPFRPLGDNVSSNDHLSGHQQQLGERLYQKVAQIHPTHAPKITGMLLDLPPTQLIMLLASEENLRQKSNEALDIINFRQRIEQENNSGSAGAAGSSNNNNNASPGILTSQSTILTTSSPSLTSGGGTTTLNIVNIESTSNVAGATGQSSKKMNPIVVLEDCQLDDNAPLFYQPGKPNIYSPRQGYPSFERINAFRNVGR
jgi:E3 ubiquitin-protein ligase EDD1